MTRQEVLWRDKQTVRHTMNKRLANYSAQILCILFIITMAAYYNYAYMKAQLIPSTQKYLESIINERSQEIYTYLDQQEKLIQQLTQDKKVIEIFIGDTKNIDKNKIESVSRLYLELPNIKNILFVEHNGDIIASMEKQEELQGKNILQAPWNISELTESFMRSSMTLTTDISGFEFNTLIKKTALFITKPIIAHDKLYGCIMLELDIEPIYLILRKYIGLKTTGEITLGRIKNNKIIYIAPTRHNPNMLFKSLENDEGSLEDKKYESKQSMKRALLSERGSGEVVDYRGDNVIAAWSYLTRLDWGIVASIDTVEILSSMSPWYFYFFLFALLIMLLFLIIIGIYRRKEIMHRLHIPALSYTQIIRICLWTGLVINIIAMFATAWYLRQTKRASVDNALHEAKHQTSQAISLINENIEQIETVIQALADDLSSGALSVEFLDKRVITDLRENPSLIEITVAYEPYAYSKDVRLHAFTMVHTEKDTFEKINIAELFDYTTPSTPGEPETTWYTKPIKQGKVWLNSAIEPYTRIPSIEYSVPFFGADKKPRGVVSISYKLEAVQKIIDEIKIGETGYGFAMAQNGALIAFPTKSYVGELASFVELAQEKADEKLMMIAERALTAKEPFRSSFFDTKTNQLYSIYIAQIKSTGWSIAIIFAEDEVSMSPLDIRHSYFTIIICLLLALLLITALMCNIENYNLSVMRKFVVPVTIILFLALLATWNVIIHTGTSHNGQKYGTIIVDESRLNKFLNEVRDNVRHSQSDEPQPLFMPTGLYLYSFSLPKIQNISLSGNIWQKLDLSLFKDIPKEIQLPQDISLTFKELAQYKEDNTEARVLTFDATIFNAQNLSEFPFDTTIIRLNLSSQDWTRNIILIPDLASYASINPKDKPGIDKDFVLPGFDIEETFFSLKKFIPDTDFGLRPFRTITEHYELIFNIVITRKLLNSFIIYILPLLVILLALFAILFGLRERIQSFDPLKPLAAYASLFFGLILLHRAIREQYGVTSTLYIEYAFFFTYITILLLVIHAVIVYGPNSNKTFDTIITPLAVYLYWPIQLSLWFITTICMFY